jgi:hypothetical protein
MLFIWSSLDYRVYHLKFNLTTITSYSTERKSGLCPPPGYRRSQPSPWHLSQVTLVARPLPQQLRKSYAGVNMVYSLSEHVFILEHHTERCGRVVNTPASYLGDPGFKFRPGDRIFLVFRDFLQSFQTNAGLVP